MKHIIIYILFLLTLCHTTNIYIEADYFSITRYRTPWSDNIKCDVKIIIDIEEKVVKIIDSKTTTTITIQNSIKIIKTDVETVYKIEDARDKATDKTLKIVLYKKYRNSLIYLYYDDYGISYKIKNIEESED